MQPNPPTNTMTATQPTPRSSSPNPAYREDLALPMQILRYDRSEYNESRPREMEGCLADNAGKVICYFPTPEAIKHAQLFAMAPEALAAIDEAAVLCDHGIPFYAYADNQAACEMADRLQQARALLARINGNT